MANKVNVAIRVRPFNRREIELSTSSIIEIAEKQTIITHPKSSKDIKTFAFDHCFQQSYSSDKQNNGDENEAMDDDGQLEIFEKIGIDVINNAFLGYNACILAYGQTGSGKSYTMMGTATSKGIIPRLCEELFKRIEKNPDLLGDSSFSTPCDNSCSISNDDQRVLLETDKSINRLHTRNNVKHKVEVSYIEIYNERVHDLLDPTGEKKSLKVREHNLLGPYVENLTILAVTSYPDIDMLIRVGNKSRVVAATNMNTESSRSHAVFTIQFTQSTIDTDSGEVSGEKVSKISLVDLAGSERVCKSGAIGERLKEGGNINKSLATLGLVISTLADQSSGKCKSNKFVPYRDSILTWLLKDNLGGNSLTTMVSTLSPSSDNYEETLSTLRFANRAKRIVNHAVVNEDPRAKVIRELKEEVAQLKIQLNLRQETETLKERLKQSEDLMLELEMPWETKLAVSEKIQQERQKALENVGISADQTGIKMQADKYYLVNLNSDPSLNEMLIYYLKKPKTIIGKSDAVPEPHIKLNGLGISPRHCEIDILKETAIEEYIDQLHVTRYGEDKDDPSDQYTVYVVPMEGASTCVNGARVTEKTQLKHGDRILWGKYHFFRLNCPSFCSLSTSLVVASTTDCNNLDDNENIVAIRERVDAASKSDKAHNRIIPPPDVSFTAVTEELALNQRWLFSNALEMENFYRSFYYDDMASVNSRQLHLGGNQDDKNFGKGIITNLDGHGSSTTGNSSFSLNFNDSTVGITEDSLTSSIIINAGGGIVNTGVLGEDTISVSSDFSGFKHQQQLKQNSTAAPSPYDSNNISSCSSYKSSKSGGGNRNSNNKNNNSLSAQKLSSENSSISSSSSCATYNLSAKISSDNSVETEFKKNFRELRKGIVHANMIVEEANTIAKELFIPVTYRVLLRIPIDNLILSKSNTEEAHEVRNKINPRKICEPAVLVKRRDYAEYIWDLDEFENKIYGMRDFYNDAKNDPLKKIDLGAIFYDVDFTEVLVGVANVYLGCLAHENLKFDYKVPIVNQQGEIAGRLCITLTHIPWPTSDICFRCSRGGTNLNCNHSLIDHLNSHELPLQQSNSTHTPIYRGEQRFVPTMASTTTSLVQTLVSPLICQSGGGLLSNNHNGNFLHNNTSKLRLTNGITTGENHECFIKNNNHENRQSSFDRTHIDSLGSANGFVSPFECSCPPFSDYPQQMILTKLEIKEAIEIQRSNKSDSLYLQYFIPHLPHSKSPQKQYQLLQRRRNNPNYNPTSQSSSYQYHRNQQKNHMDNDDQKQTIENSGRVKDGCCLNCVSSSAFSSSMFQENKHNNNNYYYPFTCSPVLVVERKFKRKRVRTETEPTSIINTPNPSRCTGQDTPKSVTGGVDDDQNRQCCPYKKSTIKFRHENVFPVEMPEGGENNAKDILNHRAISIEVWCRKKLAPKTVPPQQQTFYSKTDDCGKLFNININNNTSMPERNNATTLIIPTSTPLKNNDCNLRRNDNLTQVPSPPSPLNQDAYINNPIPVAVLLSADAETRPYPTTALKINGRNYISAKRKSLTQRWNEVRRKVQFWVSISELNEQGAYTDVKVTPERSSTDGGDITRHNALLSYGKDEGEPSYRKKSLVNGTGGVFHLRQGRQRRITIEAQVLNKTTEMPITGAKTTIVTTPGGGKINSAAKSAKSDTPIKANSIKSGELPVIFEGVLPGSILCGRIIKETNDIFNGVGRAGELLSSSNGQMQSLPLHHHHPFALSSRNSTGYDGLAADRDFVVMDSYQEMGLERLRQKWSLIIEHRKKYLERELQKLNNKSVKDESDYYREKSLMEQWIALTEERNALFLPCEGSDIPGSPADWKPPLGMEEHIPVIFLDLRLIGTSYETELGALSSLSSQLSATTTFNHSTTTPEDSCFYSEEPTENFSIGCFNSSSTISTASSRVNHSNAITTTPTTIYQDSFLTGEIPVGNHQQQSDDLKNQKQAVYSPNSCEPVSRASGKYHETQQQQLTTHFAQLKTIKEYKTDNNCLRVICSWDSSIHDSSYLNAPSSSMHDRIFLILKFGVKFSLPKPMVVWFRKRICVNVMSRKPTFTEKLKDKILSKQENSLNRCGITYEIISNIPHESNPVENIRNLAILAASPMVENDNEDVNFTEVGSTSLPQYPDPYESLRERNNDEIKISSPHFITPTNAAIDSDVYKSNHFYIQQYMASISNLNNLLAFDKLKQEAIVKERLMNPNISTEYTPTPVNMQSPHIPRSVSLYTTKTSSYHGTYSKSPIQPPNPQEFSENSFQNLNNYLIQGPSEGSSSPITSLGLNGNNNALPPALFRNVKPLKTVLEESR